MVGILHIAAVGLIAAGAFKVRETAPTVAALAGVWTGVRPEHVLAMGIVEIAVGVAVLTAGGTIAALLLALLYFGFAGFVAMALRRQGDAARCGCFGASDAPPSGLHVVMNTTLAMAAVAVAVTGPHSLPATLASQPLLGVPYLVLVVTGAVALILIVDRLPRLATAQAISSGSR